MKQKIKFKALTYRGDIVFFTHVFDCPDFSPIPPSKFHGVDIPGTTVESQVVDWLDNQDKSQMMIERDLGCIIDYWVPKKKSQKLTMVDYLKMLDFSEQMAVDLMAIYKEIKPLLKGKSIPTQVNLMLSHLNVGYEAATNAYRQIGEIIGASSSVEAKQLMSKEPLQITE